MRKFARIAIVLLLISFFGVLLNVEATSYDSGDNCLKLVGFNDGGFPVSSVTINTHTWESLDDEFRAGENEIYTITVLAGMKEDKYPRIETPGNSDSYLTYTAVPNPEQLEPVAGDDFIITIVLNNMPHNGGNGCSTWDLRIVEGPPIVNQPGQATAKISIDVSGAELEYHYVANKPDEDDVTRFKFGINNPVYNGNVFAGTSSNELVRFTFGNVTFKDNIMPPNATGAKTTNDIEDYTYGYDGSGTVSFCVNGGADDNYTKIQISGKSNNESHDYADQAPHTQTEVYEHIIGRASQFCIDGVPYDEEGYDVVVEGERQPDENLVAGFGWSYLSSDRSENVSPEEEGTFAHGMLEFVKVKYTDLDHVEHVFETAQAYNNARFHLTGEIYEWNQGNKEYSEDDRREAWGSALVPYGSELTIKVVPDEGYQLISFTESPTGFTATETPGEYKIIINKDNLYSNDAEAFNLHAEFAEIGAEVRPSSNAITSGTITTTEQVENGTIKLEVTDVDNPSQATQNGFEEAAEQNGNYEIENIIDLSLYNAIYKGGVKDNNDNYLSWDTAMNNLTNAATISLKLEDNMSGHDVIIIHEIENQNHEKEYVVVPTEFNEEQNTITFATNSFSNYAIAAKQTSTSENPETPENPGSPETPETQTYKVTFNTDGGTEYDELVLNAGDPILRPGEDPKKQGYIFDDWYEEGLTQRFPFGIEIDHDTVVYAKWIEAEYYEFEEEIGMISFTQRKNRNFSFHIMEYMNLSEEEILQFTTLENYNNEKAGIIALVADYGELLGYYEIEVEDTDTQEGIEPTEMTLKIKITDSMKAYNSFKLLYMNNQGEIEEEIEFTVEGDYLVGTLHHLSGYILVGNNISDSPNTSDLILHNVLMLIISMITLIGSTILLKNRFNN